MRNNRNLSRLAVSISVLSLLMPTGASADNQAFASQMQGTWKGNYTCSGNKTGVSIFISDKSIDQDGNRKAVFSFYPETGKRGVEGSFKGTMIFWGDRSITFSPAHWIIQPPNYVMVGFRAFSGPQQSKMQGFVQASGCSQIQIENVSEPVPEIYIEAMEGAKAKPPEKVAVVAPNLPKTLPAMDGASKAADTGVKPKALAQLPSTAIHPSDPSKTLAVLAPAPMKVLANALTAAVRPSQPNEVTPPAVDAATLKLREEIQWEAEKSKPKGEMDDSERKLQEALSGSKNSVLPSSARYSEAELAAMPNFQREAILKDAGTSREDGISDEEKGRRQEQEMAVGSAEDAKLSLQEKIARDSVSANRYLFHRMPNEAPQQSSAAAQFTMDFGGNTQVPFRADMRRRDPSSTLGNDPFFKVIIGITAAMVVYSINDYNSLTPEQKAIRDKEIAENSKKLREQSNSAPPPQTMYEMERDNKTVECFVTMGDSNGC